MAFSSKFKLSGVLLALFVLARFSDGKGKKKDHRIISGRVASIEEFPYQVSIESYGSPSCGGSILSPQFVLTAAHCVASLDQKNVDPFELGVRVGTSKARQGGKMHYVRAIKAHARYNNNDPVDHHDIALLLLATPIAFNKKAQPVKLPPPSGTPRPGKMVWVTGYGKQDIERRRRDTRVRADTTDLLMAVELPIVDLRRCARILLQKGAIVAEDMICAGNAMLHKDACRGDSGGPLVANNTLYGIVAWGVGCGQLNTPGVYTNVARYVAWIRNSAKIMMMSY